MKRITIFLFVSLFFVIYGNVVSAACNASFTSHEGWFNCQTLQPSSPCPTSYRTDRYVTVVCCDTGVGPYGCLGTDGVGRCDTFSNNVRNNCRCNIQPPTREINYTFCYNLLGCPSTEACPNGTWYGRFSACQLVNVPGNQCAESHVETTEYSTAALCDAACTPACTYRILPLPSKYICTQTVCDKYYCSGTNTISASCKRTSCTSRSPGYMVNGNPPVPQPPPSINDFYISNLPLRKFNDSSKHYYMLLRNQAQLYNLNVVWSTNYASSCTAGCSQGSCSPDWRGSVGTSGSRRVKNAAVAGEHIYTLTCTGAGGSKTATLRVLVKSFSWFEIIPRISMLPGREALASLVNFL